MSIGISVTMCRAAGLAACVFLAGCVGGYTIEESCADLSKMVWPWRSMTDTRTETLAGSGPTAVIEPERVVRVSGTLPAGGRYLEPTPAIFQCQHSGNALRSFGWIEPQMLADPDFGRPPG